YSITRLVYSSANSHVAVGADGWADRRLQLLGGLESDRYKKCTGVCYFRPTGVEVSGMWPGVVVAGSLAFGGPRRRKMLFAANSAVDYARNPCAANQARACPLGQLPL